LVDARLQRALQTERIEGRKDWVRYVELKTALYRKQLAHIESELGTPATKPERPQAERS
jgi:hypothetical protein